MAKRKDGGVAGLYGDIRPVPAAERQELDAARGSLMQSRLEASARGDMAGTPLGLYSHPATYQQRVMRVWNAYHTDALFARMINRSIEFAANGSQWEVPTQDNDESWLKRITNWAKPGRHHSERQEEFWNAWAEQVNTDVDNTVRGLDNVISWAVKHMLLSGMFVPHWKLGVMKFGKQDFLVPKQITCYPASAISLIRERSLFMSESIMYRIGNIGKVPMYEGAAIEAPERGTTRQTAGMIELEQIGSQQALDGTTESFCLKFNWSPGDLVTLRAGQSMSTGAGIYPAVPFFTLMPEFLMRQKLKASDLGILDAVINFILLWQVGDKDHPPVPPEKNSSGVIVKDGTIAAVRKLLQEGRVGPAMELFVPYYVNLKIIMPDTAMLTSATKYDQSSKEIFQAFGIFPSTGARDRMEKTNVSNFEEFLGNIRRHVAAFLHLLTAHIVTINPGKLNVIPSWSPNPLNTKTEQFFKELHNLANIGRVSTRTMLRYIGLDDAVELRRIARDLSTDADEVYDDNVPTSYVQKSTPSGSDGEKVEKQTKTKIPPTKQKGRPVKATKAGRRKSK